MIGPCVATAGAAGWKQRYYEVTRVRLVDPIDEPPVNWNGVYVAKDE